MIGIDLPRSTVAKHMVRHRRPPSATWRAFLKNHIREIVAADFFVVPTVRNQILFVFLVLAHHRRRVLHWQNPFVERLIGSIRRECLDHVIVVNERHLKRILADYFRYYHRWRTHQALEMCASSTTLGQTGLQIKRHFPEHCGPDELLLSLRQGHVVAAPAA
jgi:transposase InsO family protein